MIYFVTGIDTGIGKTWVTACWGKSLLAQGRSVITAKLVQTGARGPEDVLTHRRLMDQAWTTEDEQGLTCPFVFPFPASPHLAARLAGQRFDAEKLDSALERLASQYDEVLLEGAGGVLVPLNEDLLTLDFVSARKLPCLVVTTPRLGSLNQTLLTLEALQSRKVTVLGLVYNLGFPAAPEIVADTRDWLRSRFPDLPWVEVPAGSSSQDLPVLPEFRSLLVP